MDIAAVPDHLHEDVVNLWRECGLTRPWNDPHADLRRAVDATSSTVLAALDGGMLQGSVMVGHDGHRGWIYYLAVGHAARRQGLGRRLMAAAEAWVREQGIPKIMLMVRESNTDVVEFYDRLGYTDQGSVVLGRFFDEALNESRATASG